MSNRKSRMHPYLARLFDYPLLNGREEEVCLSRIIHRLAPPKEDVEALEKDRQEKEKARQRFIQGNLRLVVSVAKKFAKRYQLDLFELIQEGSLILFRAVDGFDPDRKTKFSTYLTRALNKEYKRIVGESYYPSTLYPVHRRILDVAATIRNEEERDPTPQEIVVRSGESLVLVKSALERSLPLKSLLTSHLADCVEGDLVAQHLEREEDLQRVSRDLRDVVELVRNCQVSDDHKNDFFDRYGLGGECLGSRKTLRQVAQRAGVTRERVRQRVKTVLGKIRS